MTKISDDGLDIMALLQLTMDRADVEEFLAVYKGVVHEYPAMVDELSCGPCIAMEICGTDAQAALRQLAGPPDPVRISGHVRLYLSVCSVAGLRTCR